MAYYLVNTRRGPDGHPADTEYDYGGNTRILPTNSRTKIEDQAEVQLALTKWQNAGVVLEEGDDLPEGPLDEKVEAEVRAALKAGKRRHK